MHPTTERINSMTVSPSPYRKKDHEGTIIRALMDITKYLSASRHHQPILWDIHIDQLPYPGHSISGGEYR